MPRWCIYNISPTLMTHVNRYKNLSWEGFWCQAALSAALRGYLLSLTNYRFRHNIACIISNPQWHGLNRSQQKKSQINAANDLYFHLNETRHWSSVKMKDENTSNANISTRTLSTSHPHRRESTGEWGAVEPGLC